VKSVKLAWYMSFEKNWFTREFKIFWS
jgi:hypothetical protein